MLTNVDEKKQRFLFLCLSIIVTIVTLFPVACNYIMQGGIIHQWIAKVQTVAEGAPFLFLESKLWYLFPGILYSWTGSIVLVYRIWMLLIQCVTALTALLFFERVFVDREGRMGAFFGFLLYMTCPYRIYVCYDLADLSLALVWMLMPLYGWALLGLIRRGKALLNLAVGAVALAGIGYAHAVSFVILCGMGILIGICSRKWLLLVTSALSAVLFLPGLYKLVRYLFLDGYEELQIPVRLIMGNGYRLGEYFTVYTWKAGHPGMGMGLMIALGAGLWLAFVRGMREEKTQIRWFLTAALLAAILGLRYFPWDFVQRLGEWALKFVTLMESPALFAGIAYALLSVAGASYTERISREEDFVAFKVVPLLILLFCVGLCVYQCNTLTYERLPMDLQ